MRIFALDLPIVLPGLVHNRTLAHSSNHGDTSNFITLLCPSSSRSLSRTILSAFVHQQQSKMRPSFDASELPRLVFINESQRYDKSNCNCALSPRSNEAPKLGKNVDTQNASSRHNDNADRDLKARRVIALVKARSEDETEKLRTTIPPKKTRDSTTTAS